MKTDFELGKHYKYDDDYISMVTVKCRCGHSVSIYNRFRREICSYCGRMVFLTKKDEFKYKLKRKGV
nr:MAG TPA: 30S ribosomal protein S27 [Caudoviricetes sp.]